MEGRRIAIAKLYTSRFSNKELESGKYTVVGIVRSMPKFPVKYSISGNVAQIAPPGYLWNENNRERFKAPYFTHLEKSGYPVIGGIIQYYLDAGRDVILCCYEDVRKSGEWCHRLVFTEWWCEKTGQKVEELIDPSPDPGAKQRKQEEQKRQEEECGYEQLSFMSDLQTAMHPHYTHNRR